MKSYIVSVMYFDEEQQCYNVHDKVVVAINGEYDSSKILKTVCEEHPEYDNNFYTLQIDDVVIIKGDKDDN